MSEVLSEVPQAHFYNTGETSNCLLFSLYRSKPFMMIYDDHLLTDYQDFPDILEEDASMVVFESPVWSWSLASKGLDG